MLCLDKSFRRLLNFEDESMMRCRFAIFQAVKVKTNWRSCIFWSSSCQSTWRPSLFPIGSLNEILIPIGSLFQLQHNLLAWLKQGHKLMQKFLCGLEYMFCLFT
jgi:hypothetical protein